MWLLIDGTETAIAGSRTRRCFAGALSYDTVVRREFELFRALSPEIDRMFAIFNEQYRTDFV